MSSRARMLAAGEIVAAEAAGFARVWSRQIPPGLRVDATSDTVTITSQVGPSYPNEVPRVRHPVFGNPRVWVTNEYRPFLVQAADRRIDEATAVIARVVDDDAAAL